MEVCREMRHEDGSLVVQHEDAQKMRHDMCEKMRRDASKIRGLHFSIVPMRYVRPNHLFHHPRCGDRGGGGVNSDVLHQSHASFSSPHNASLMRLLRIIFHASLS